MTSMQAPEGSTGILPEEASPDGALAAALIAVGIGVFTLGLVTCAAEAALGFKDWLKWDDTVGPLSGKSSVALIAWAASWPLLHLALFRRDGVLPAAIAVAGTLFVLGMIGIFPPVFEELTVE